MPETWYDLAIAMTAAFRVVFKADAEYCKVWSRLSHLI